MLSPINSQNKIPFSIESPIRAKIGSDRWLYMFIDDKWQQVPIRFNNGNLSGYTPVTQWFGQNAVNFYAELGWDGHNGIDFKAPHRTNIYAVADGLVGGISESWGAVYINSDVYFIDGVETYFCMGYGHLDTWKVKVGQQVKKGDLIGYADNRGQSTTGSHLHLQCMPYYWSSRDRWFADTGNRYAGCVNFNVQNLTIYYEQPMKHLQSLQEIVDAYIRKGGVLGVDEENFLKIQNGDKTLVDRIKKDHKGMFFRPEHNGEFYELED